MLIYQDRCFDIQLRSVDVILLLLEHFDFFFEILAQCGSYYSTKNFPHPHSNLHNPEIFLIFCQHLTAEFVGYECTADMLFVFFFITLYSLDAVTAQTNFSQTTSAFELVIIQLLTCCELQYSLMTHWLLPICLLYSYFSHMFSIMRFDSRMGISRGFLKCYLIRYWSAELLLHIVFYLFFANVALPSVFRSENLVDDDQHVQWVACSRGTHKGWLDSNKNHCNS